MPELNWMGDAAARRAAQRVPYRLLQLEQTVGEGEGGLPPDNLLVQGDNLEALKSLLPLYAGRVKCIFIDPPYNTKSAFEHYDDNLEHSQWLSMMYPRLVLLRELLAEDGSIWVTLDDNEAHYFKVVCDEVFARQNYIASIAWRKRDGAPNDRKIGSVHDHLMVWGKAKHVISKATLAEVTFNLMERTEKANAQYRVFNEPGGPDPRGPFRKIDTTANGKGGRFVESLFYPVRNPNTGVEVWPRKGTCWRHSREHMAKLQDEGRLYWGVDGKANTPMRKLFLHEAKAGMTAPTIWEDAGLNQHASREMEVLFGEKAAFETPKPEFLLQRIIHIASNPGDLVLDSFLGSGTTAAVAHKMGRRWIGIEMGEHARTHCLPRLEKVVEGEQGGISQAVGWQGGGGFRFATLGEPVFDAEGRINPAVRFAPLAAYVWREQTHTPHPTGVFDSPLLGVHGDTAFALLYNGILGDRRPDGGNVLTLDVWQQVRALAPGHAGPWRIYGEACRLPPGLMKRHGIVFRQIPYQLGAD
jgi:adenine-specific DNA-methyltransferase